MLKDKQNIGTKQYIYSIWSLFHFVIVSTRLRNNLHASNITDGALSSISEGVMRLARAGRMTCKVGRDFKIITEELSRVSLVISNIRGYSICFPKSLYKKTTSNEILGELKAAFKSGESKVPRPRPVLLSLLWQAWVNSQLSPTPITTKRKGEEGRN